MHYIIGTRFEVDINSTGAVDNQSLLARRNKKYFPDNGVYELYYIQPKPDKQVDYTFMNTSNRQTIKITFKSTRDADNVIATFTGDTVPDYDQRYKDEVMKIADQ